jgi:hypothetical protein
MIVANETRMVLPISPLIVLGIIFLASLAVFIVLTRRWTSRRMYVAFLDFAEQRRFHLRAGRRAFVPPPLTELKNPAPQVCWLLENDTTSIVRIETALPQNDPASNTAAPWNVLVRRTISDWPSTGLRPAAQKRSLLDLFSLGSFPLVAANDRFTIFGNDPAAARRIGESHAIALLPPDIGLLRHGEYLLLDFSTRPFDPIEFGRMLSLVDQLEKTG